MTAYRDRLNAGEHDPPKPEKQEPAGTEQPEQQAPAPKKGSKRKTK